MIVMKNNVCYKPDNYYSGIREEMLIYIPSCAKTILEVGCGDGNFGRMIKSRYHAEVWGIEICEPAIDRAGKKLDKVLMGNFEQDALPLPREYFDCVIFNDVLEHFINPWEALEKTKICLKKDGCVVSSIPNVRYFYNIKALLKHKEWNYTKDGILDSTHLRFFTIKSIQALFQSCGFNVLKIEGINTISFPWKFRMLNWLLMCQCEDMKYLRFACVAQKNT